MAFSRSFLKTMGLTDEQVTAIMEEHVGVVDALKKQRDDYKADADKYKADADKLPEVQKELDGIKGGEDYKAKYEKLNGEFDAYKKQIAANEQTQKVKEAYKKLLIGEKIAEKRLELIMSKTDFSGMKLTDKGELENVKDLKQAIDKDWGFCKQQTVQRMGQVENPPQVDNGGNNMGSIRQMTAQWHAARYGTKQTEQKG